MDPKADYKADYKAYKPIDVHERLIWSHFIKNEHVTHADLDALGGSTWRKDNFIGKLKRLDLVHDISRARSKAVFTVTDIKGAQVVLSRLRSGPSTHSCSLSFEGQGAFAT